MFSFYVLIEEHLCNKFNYDKVQDANSEILIKHVLDYLDTLFKKRILPLQDIRNGLLAFQLTAKEQALEYLPLIENIERVFKPDMQLNKVQYQNYERFINMNNLPKKHTIYHLEEVQFQDNRPQSLVLKTLDNDLKDKVFRYEGQVNKEGNQHTFGVHQFQKSDLKESLIKANRSIYEIQLRKQELIDTIEQEKTKKMLKQQNLKQSLLLEQSENYKIFQRQETPKPLTQEEIKKQKEEEDDKKLRDQYGLLSQAQRIMIKLLQRKDIGKVIKSPQKQVKKVEVYYKEPEKDCQICEMTSNMQNNNELRQSKRNLKEFFQRPQSIQKRNLIEELDQQNTLRLKLKTIKPASSVQSFQSTLSTQEFTNKAQSKKKSEKSLFAVDRRLMTEAQTERINTSFTRESNLTNTQSAQKIGVHPFSRTVLQPYKQIKIINKDLLKKQNITSSQHNQSIIKSAGDLNQHQNFTFMGRNNKFIEKRNSYSHNQTYRKKFPFDKKVSFSGPSIVKIV
ncbi:UNKNOWN [Stylonychia lemnae]|uniref:Uncharacterized protein n=1 Tax=Stylonychia lemnae TaxID=5949 RepID=A0A078A9G4_STYLE|nr:UNKNOWN [Stylonychia lemnae]|eukprot:CDW78501.1 UNKNOWN [Stylonychia lemnae]